MKKYFTLFIAFILGFSFVQAQDIEVYSTDTNVEIPSPTSNVKAYLDVINISSETINVDWERAFEDLPRDWRTWVCDANFCYSDDQDASSIPNEILPGDTSKWYVEVDPEGQMGSLEICLILTRNSDGSVLDSFCTTMSAGVVSAEGNLTDTDAYLFPNPSRVFQLSESDGVERIMVSDIMGRQILDVNTITSNTVNLSEARAGVYFATFLDGDNRKVGNQRIVVR